MHQIVKRTTQVTSAGTKEVTTEAREILGFPVLVATHNEAIAAMDDHFQNATPSLVTFLNAHVSNVAAQNETLGDVLRSSLILNDGVGIEIASLVLHRKSFPDNLNGTDLIPRYLRDTRHAFRIYAVGAIPGVAARALDALQSIAPQHEYVGSHHGYLTDDESIVVLDDIEDKQANLVLVAMGSPRQEIWVAKHLMKRGGLRIICVGGLLDFVSEEKPRAPEWVRSLRCEWVFRLVNEPRRLWRRYLIGNAIFMARLGAAYVRSS